MRLSRPPPLRSLRVFCIAARNRSFKVAASELFLTPSAVSHQIKELEDVLGVRLFERKVRALELTTAGRILLDEVEPLLKALDSSLAQFVRRNSRRRLQVLAPPFFASELLVPRLATFCTAHPDVDVQIEAQNPRPSVHPATAQASILLTDSPPIGLVAERLFSVRLSAVCAREHVAKVARLGSSVFAELGLIVHKARPFAWNSWAEELGLETPEPKSIIELDSMFSVVRAAEAGLGIALVPDALCGAWLRSGALIKIFALELPISDTYYAVCRAKDAERPEVAAWMTWAVEEFRSLDTGTCAQPAAPAAMR